MTHSYFYIQISFTVEIRVVFFRLQTNRASLLETSKHYLSFSGENPWVGVWFFAFCCDVWVFFVLGFCFYDF